MLAGSLAVLGLYGVIAYMVARRRNEIGVRIALGASRGRVIGLVLREAVVLLAIGLTVGTALALWAGRAAASLIYGMTPRDPLTLGAAVALLAAVALIAIRSRVESVAAAAHGCFARRVVPYLTAIVTFCDGISPTLNVTGTAGPGITPKGTTAFTCSTPATSPRPLVEMLGHAVFIQRIQQPGQRSLPVD